MNRNRLANEITASLTDEEWEGLENGTLGVPVSEHNRKTLLRLRDSLATFPGEVDDGYIDDLKKDIKAFLEREWAEEPEAHKYVILACLALSCVFMKPLHPASETGYYTLVAEGVAEYFCPAREEGTVCSYCIAQGTDDLFALWDDKAADTENSYGKVSADIQREVFRSGFLESGIIAVDDLEYFDAVRDMCASNQCSFYGSTWACPPAVGTVEECRKRVEKFRTMQLFSKAYMLEDDYDLEGMIEAGRDFKRCARMLRKKLNDIVPGNLMLANESCDMCKKCTYPDAPCRFPDDMFHAIEGYGFNVSKLAGQAGIMYINGQSTVTFFGAVLY